MRKQAILNLFIFGARLAQLYLSAEAMHREIATKNDRAIDSGQRRQEVSDMCHIAFKEVDTVDHREINVTLSENVERQRWLYGQPFPNHLAEGIGFKTVLDLEQIFAIVDLRYNQKRTAVAIGRYLGEHAFPGSPNQACCGHRRPRVHSAFLRWGKKS